MRKTILVLASLFVAVNSFASDISDSVGKFAVKEGSSLAVTIAKHSLTRVRAKDDGIDRVKYVGGALQIEQDEGDLYLMPTTDSDEPISIFVVTEQGYTYSLILHPKKIPTRQIYLINSALHKKEELSVASLKPASLKSEQLLNVLPKGGKIRGFSYKDCNEFISSDVNSSIRKIGEYKGNGLLGEILLVNNKTNKPISLNLATLRDKKTAGIAGSKAIPARDISYLYRVKRGA